MIRRTALAAVILFLTASTTPSLQAALDTRVAGAPGTAIAAGVIDHGIVKIYVAGSSGNGKAVDEHTLFEIGSVSKTLTATALAAMVLAGQVHLSDPIANYLPAKPGICGQRRSLRSLHAPGHVRIP